MAATLVITTDIHQADSRLRRAVDSYRSSYGNLQNFNQMQMQLAVGESHEFEFTTCFHAYIRDICDIDLYDADNNVVHFTDVTGTFCWPTSGKVVISVPAGSTISLERVIKVVYS